VSFQEDSTMWQEARDKAYEELNYRRQNRICARCGTTVWCYVKEITKYRDYILDCRYEHHNNSIDDKAAQNGSGICTPCGGEIITGLLGANSKRVKNNEDYEIDKLTKIRKLCAEHKELLQKRTTLTNRIYKDEHTRSEDEEAAVVRLSDTRAESAINEDNIRQIESKIDSLVNLSYIEKMNE
jgi:hypothetical protein